MKKFVSIFKNKEIVGRIFFTIMILFVIRSGATGLNKEHKHVIEYSLKLDSNPEFTSSAIVAFARAIGRMAARGETGARTVFDIAPADLSPLSREELRAHML